jgi:hypothetical protein
MSTITDNLTTIVQDLREEQNQQRAALAIYSKLVDNLTAKIMKAEQNEGLFRRLLETNKALRQLAITSNIQTGDYGCLVCHAEWSTAEERHMPDCVAEEVISG